MPQDAPHGHKVAAQLERLITHHVGGLGERTTLQFLLDFCHFLVPTLVVEDLQMVRARVMARVVYSLGA